MSAMLARVARNRGVAATAGRARAPCRVPVLARHAHLSSSSSPPPPPPIDSSLSQSLSMASPVAPLFLNRRMAGPLSDQEIADFHRDGYLVKRKFYSADEMSLLLDIAKTDRAINTHAIDVPDSGGRISKLTVWNYLSTSADDVYGLIGRGRRMVESMEQLLGDEVYHYHSKLMMKEPHVGGEWSWHQDYGYWYQNGCLTPRMASGLIAIDRATVENGCLQVLKGSHLLGRIDHGTVAGQTGANLDIVDAVKRFCPLIYVECEPGDTLLFHSNLLHSSAPNQSHYPRWSLICCYNARSNDPVKKSHHPRYHPLVKAEDSEIMALAQRLRDGEVSPLNDEQLNAERLAAFLNPDDDESTPGSRKSTSSAL